MHNNIITQITIPMAVPSVADIVASAVSASAGSCIPEFIKNTTQTVTLSSASLTI